MPVKPILIGIGGISGSGKSHLLDVLKKRHGNKISIISFDDYYKPISSQIDDENGHKNFDLPSALHHDLLTLHMIELKEGQTVVHKKYQFENFEKPEEELLLFPAQIIIIEGLFVFEFPEIDNILDLRIYMETNLEVSLNRRLSRDKKERGISRKRSLYQWQNHVLPAFQQYIEPHRSRCDLVLNGEDDSEIHLKLILEIMELKKITI